MKLDPELLKILVCPVCKGGLRQGEDKLVCRKCGRCYPIIEGIPYLLPEDLLEILRLGRSPSSPRSSSGP